MRACSESDFYIPGSYSGSDVLSMLGDGAGHEFEGCVKYFLIGLVEVTEMEGKEAEQRIHYAGGLESRLNHPISVGSPR